MPSSASRNVSIHAVKSSILKLFALGSIVIFSVKLNSLSASAAGASTTVLLTTSVPGLPSYLFVNGTVTSPSTVAVTVRLPPSSPVCSPLLAVYFSLPASVIS